MLTTKTSPHIDIISRAGNLAPSTKRKYISEIERLLAAGVDPRNREALAAYAAGLSQSSRAFLKASLAILFADTITSIKAGATAGNLSEVQAALYNIEAMSETIQVQAPKGKTSSLWLTSEQVEQITSLPDRNTVQGRRDWIILGTMLGAGLRRSEMASLTFDQLKRQPKKNGQLRGILDVTGKGSKKRTIPIKPLLEERLREWNKEVGGGNVARSINKAGVLNGSLSDKAINDIVHKYGALIGLPELEAHSTRRTWAQLGLNAGVPIQQISALLGHSNIAVTQIYLDMHINLESSISDFIPLN